MSCRVLGLEIETAVVNVVLSKLRENYEGEFFAKVFETEANIVCRDVFQRCGFIRTETDDKIFVLSEPIKQPAPHVTLEFITHSSSLS